MSAQPNQGEMTDALAEELWGHGLELDSADLLEALAAAGLRLDVDPDGSIWTEVYEQGDEISPEFATKLNDIRTLHEMIHTAEDDPDDTLFATLTEKEFLIIVLGLLHAGIQHCCLDTRAAQLAEKFFQTYNVQRAEVD